MSNSASAKPRIVRYRKTRWAIGLVLVYTLVGFFLLPAILKRQLIDRLPEYTKRNVTIDNVKINPYALSLTIEGLALRENDGTRFATFNSIYVNLQLSSIVRGGFVFDEVTLTNLQVQITRETNGVFNFANLLPSDSPTSGSAKPAMELPRIFIEKFNLDAALIGVLDRARKTPFVTTIAPININLTKFTTVRDEHSPYAFNAKTESGESFSWSGQLTVNPLQSNGSLKLGGIKLKKYVPYSEDYTPVEILDGVVEVGANYQVAFAGPTGLQLDISKGTLHLAGLQLKATGDAEPFLTLPEFAIDGIEASLAKRSVHVGQVSASGAKTTIRRERDGSLQLQHLINLPKSETPAAPASVGKANAVWTAGIDEIRFDDFAVTWLDQQPAVPAQIKLDKLTLNLKSVSNQTNAPIQTSLALRWNDSGNISVEGPIVVLPNPSASLKIKVAGLDLRPLHPYISEQLQLSLLSGAIGTEGQVQLSLPDAGGPRINFKGDFGLTNLTSIDTVAFKDFVALQSLTVSGIVAELPANRFQASEVKLSGLKTTLVILSNKVSNLQAIFPAKPAAGGSSTPIPAQSATNPTAFTAQVGAVVFDQASLNFIDQSIQPNCFFNLQELSGSIRGLSTEKLSTSPVDLKGRVDEASSFSVTGKINPLPRELFVDLAVAMKNMDLTPFTPYMEKFGGYPMNKGKLSLTLNYLINQKALQSSNVIHLDQLTLGAYNSSPDATKLPVRLGIALLKDRNGRIALDVPVAGRLDDPKFRVSPIILQVVVNMLTKAATSPFSLLGSMFGGGEELSFVAFEPGQAIVPPGELKKLNTMTTALYERPALSLEIKGSADSAKDRPALALFKLDQQLKTMRLKELAAAGDTSQSIEQLKLTPTDSQRLTLSLYQQTFGTNQIVVTNPIVAITNVVPVVTTAVPKPAPAVRRTSTAGMRGVEYLALAGKRPVAAKSQPVASTPTVVTNTVPSPVATTEPAATTLTPEAMLAALVAKMEVTDNDLRKLMQDRAHAVQSYLLQSGKVTAERLFLISPKPTDSTTTGELRVNLSLN